MKTVITKKIKEIRKITWKEYAIFIAGHFGFIVFFIGFIAIIISSS